MIEKAAIKLASISESGPLNFILERIGKLFRGKVDSFDAIYPHESFNDYILRLKQSLMEDEQKKLVEFAATLISAIHNWSSSPEGEEKNILIYASNEFSELIKNQKIQFKHKIDPVFALIAAGIFHDISELVSEEKDDHILGKLHAKYVGLASAFECLRIDPGLVLSIRAAFFRDIGNDFIN